jgi:hypothetical protein
MQEIAVKIEFELWRLVAVRDEQRSTWELIGRFPSVRKARAHINQLAGSNVVSPEETTYWFEDEHGV